MADKKFDTMEAVHYFNGTDLVITSFLRDKKLPLTLESEVEKEIRFTGRRKK